MGEQKLSKQGAAVQGWIEAKSGAVAVPLSARKGSAPLAVMYKVGGKIFAILSLRGSEYVILKCDRHLATLLRQEYSGVGHRSHLDRRFWISVTLDADVPGKEIRRLISQSYDLVCATLTGKQKSQLARPTRAKGRVKRR